MSKSSKKWVGWSLTGLVVLLLIAWGAWQAFLAPTKMHAVKLSNGALYFGELTHFPDYGLKNVYTIQATGNQQQPLSVQRFRNTFWGPEDFININEDEVLWTVELRSDSRLSQLIEQNPNLVPQQQGQQQVPQGAPRQAPQQGTGQTAPPSPDQGGEGGQ